MRHALLASLFLALAGCAGASTTVRGPAVEFTHNQSEMGVTPVTTVGPGFGDRSIAYSSKDMGATPSYTLADIR